MLRVVADTNIYISGLIFGGLPDRVLSLARMGRIQLFTCDAIFSEIERVLTRKFYWPDSRARVALAEIKTFTLSVERGATLSVIRNDDADNRILECAVAANAEFIVTGDRHLRGLGAFGGISIVGPRALLDAIRDER